MRYKVVIGGKLECLVSGSDDYMMFMWELLMIKMLL